MKKHLLWALLIFAPLAYSASTPAYQATARNINATGQFCTTTTTRCNITGTGAQYHQLSWNVTGTVSSCSLQVDSSADGVSWSAGAVIAIQSCTVGGNVTSTAVTTNFVRVNVTAFVGTGSVTTNLQGFVNNPSGGSGGLGNPVLINQSVDVFNRTGTGLGANWTAFLNGINTTLGPPGFAVGTTTNLDVSSFTSVTSNPTQRVRVGYLVMGTSSAGPALRINGTPTISVNFYVCSLTNVGLSIIRVIGASNGSVGTVTTLATTALTGVAGDFVDFGVVGNDLTCERNGAVASGFLQVHDTSPITSGAPGIETSNLTTELGYWTFFNPIMPGSGTENIVFDGDSIIAANGNGSPQTDPATSFLFIPNTTAYAANLGVGGKCLGVGCAAVSSGTLDSMLSTGTSVVDPLFIPGTKNIVVLFTASNDIAVGSRTPSQVITDITTYVTNRHAVGWKVIVCQSLSRLATTTPAIDQQEVTLAQLIATNSMGADAVVIWPYILTSMGSSMNTSLFVSDQIHPTELTHIGILSKVLSAALEKF